MRIGGWGHGVRELLAEKEPALRSEGALFASGCEHAGARAGWECRLWGRVDQEASLRSRYGGPTTSLGETLCLACAELGPEAAGLLRGTFVMIALDVGDARGYVIRDQLGGWPLVYAPLADGVLFAEHERDLLEILPARPGPDIEALASWVDIGVLPLGRTLFAGIRRVSPGHRLELSPGRVATRRWWSPKYRDPALIGRTEASELVREAAFAAVDRAAAGSALPGVRLSGGLDSACVAAGLAARGDGEAVAISAVFPETPDTDERGLIEATAQHVGIGVDLISFDAGARVLPDALRQIDRWEVPPASPNAFVWTRALARARELGVDALLDGEGGDELFGMAPELIADRLRAGRLSSAWQLTGGIPGTGPEPSFTVRRRALRVFGVGPLIPTWARALRHRGEERGDSLFAPDVRSAPDGASDDHLLGPLWWQSLADRPSYGEMLGVGAHLRRVDEASGVDRRHPFLLDLGLFEAILSIPPDLQFDSLRDRPLLRDGLRGRIPEAVRTRYAKSYFSPLLIGALGGPEGSVIDAVLSDPGAPIRAYVDGSRLDALIARGPELSAGAAIRLWRAATTDLWLRDSADRDLFRPCD